MQDDISGRENILSAIREAIKHYRQRHKALLKLVVWTDESGDDLDQLEAVIQLCKAEKVSVTVIGPSAVLGCPLGTHAWYSPETRSYHLLPVAKGPEGAFPLRPSVFRWQKRAWDETDASEWILDPQRTPLPPYALMRLTRETGGSYVVFDRETDRSEHQLTDFEQYLPDYRSEAEIRSEFSQYPLRRVLVEAVGETYYQHHRLPPRLDFMEFWYTQAEFRTKFAPALATEHAYARELESRVERALGPLLRPEMDELYQKEPSAYWRAYYDLSKGLLLAASVRFREYGLACEWITRSLHPATNAVYFNPANQLLSGDWGNQRQAEAHRCFDRCLERSPGTPWADLAQQQRKYYLGFRADQQSHPPPSGAATPFTRPSLPNL